MKTCRGVSKMKAPGLLPIMQPGACIKFTVFEAAGYPHFVRKSRRVLNIYIYIDIDIDIQSTHCNRIPCKKNEGLDFFAAYVAEDICIWKLRN